jgi:hypothetical protein
MNVGSIITGGSRAQTIIYSGPNLRYALASGANIFFFRNRGIER